MGPLGTLRRRPRERNYSQKDDLPFYCTKPYTFTGPFARVTRMVADAGRAVLDETALRGVVEMTLACRKVSEGLENL